MSDTTTTGATIDLDEALAVMATIREFEDRVLELRSAGDVAGSVHTCQGQEAAPVGVCAALGPQDRVIATYRGHGWAIARGVPLAALFAEIMGRADGTNGGRGGSAYLSAPEHGFLGENSIVGAGLPIANGVALALRHLATDGVAVVSFGDGATNQGAAHEALVLAVARGLPVVFVCENNGWSEMTPISATVPVPLHERAAGYGLAAEAVDGSDVVAVAEAAQRAVVRARSGEGPTFLEIEVGRIRGHYNADLEQYRPAEDREAAAARDPLLAMAAARGAEPVERARAAARSEIDAAVAVAAAGPLPPVAEAADHVLGAAAAPPAVDAELVEMSYQRALNEALRRALSERAECVLFGEDVAVPGGVFGVSRGLLNEFGAERVFDTPISEAAILGAALGGALEGLRPIAEIMWADFSLVALDQLVNQAANVRYLARGRRCAPLTVRMQQGIAPGSCAQHCQSLEALFAHVPGLRVGLPATPGDAYEMLLTAVACDDPTVLIESRVLYADKGPVALGCSPRDPWSARERRAGRDLALITWGRMSAECLAAAEQLQERGLAACVLDLRWLNPLDFEAIRAAVAPSGRVVIAHEANLTGGFGAEVAARIAFELFDDLDAPPARVALPDVRVPASPILQGALMPTSATIVDAALALAS